ncbi:MAG: hypothetical protein K2G15_02690, partial [Muribaculaceae bacterium]|nr:hypothetical protein [Muribaculaceae bacterium]
RIGIRLSIALTGLRGAPATMERKLHDFCLNFRYLWRGRATVARAPRSQVAVAESRLMVSVGDAP